MAEYKRSEWWKGTIWSLVPCISRVGDRTIGIMSTFTNLSPYRVHPGSMTTRKTDRKGAWRIKPPTGPSPGALSTFFFAVRADLVARKHEGPDPNERP
jgi:hypothetical protein